MKYCLFSYLRDFNLQINAMNKNLFLIVAVLFFSCSNSEFKSNKSQNITKSDSLVQEAYSLYKLGQTYSEDSMNQVICES